MFSFIKKTTTGGDRETGDKERRKRDKKEQKTKRERGASISPEEQLLRVDEVRKSLKLTRRRKEKEKLPSGITADYTADFLASLDRLECGHTQSDSSETSLNAPVPPLPPKRGILKTVKSRSDVYENLQPQTPPAANGLLTMTTAATSPSNDSLTDTTNSSFATPPFSLSPHPDDGASSSSLMRLPLPPIVSLELPAARTLVVARQPPPRTDFGFSLRRAMVLERHGAGGAGVQAVIFAEPGATPQHRNDTGLLPGDKLLRVNGVSVETRSREQIIELIRASGDSVTLLVQPVAELSELSRRCTHGGRELLLADANIRCGTLRRSASHRFTSRTTAKSDEQMATEKRWMDADLLWLVHDGGFTRCRRDAMHSPTVGRLRVRLVDGGCVSSLLVDEDDVEVCNPPQFDRVEDLAALQHANESSALHTLRQRFANSLIHTYAGGASLLIVNPMRQLSIYSEKVVALFRGCAPDDMPPHIYATAQSAYHALLATRKDQSIVFVGRSGGGKTTNLRHCAHYLLAAAGGAARQHSVDKLAAVWTVLEAFGNCRTPSNANATRFTQIFALDFDAAGVVVSASIQPLMFERRRVFHILEQLLAGVDGALRSELALDGNLARSPRAVTDFAKVRHALSALGATDADSRALWRVLAAGHHLSEAGCVRSSSSRWQFNNPASAARAAQLLGTAIDELARIIFESDDGPDAIEAFVVGLYAEVFNGVVALLNRALAPSGTHSSIASILLVDAPGFQSAPTGGFDDLCDNYVQERLQLLCHHTNHVVPRDRYVQEHVDVPPQPTVSDPTPLVHVLDRDAGLLSLLDDMTQRQSTATDESFVERLCALHPQPLVCRAGARNEFVLQHMQQTHPMLYSAAGWLKHAREHPVTQHVAAVLQESCREDISKLFAYARGFGGGSMLGNVDGTQSLRRVSSMRRTATMKRKSICMQTKHAVDGLVETIRRTKIRFVHCLLPQHDAANRIENTDTVDGCDGVDDDDDNDGVVNVPLLRLQIRGAQIMDTVRLHKQGFPVFMPLGEFRRRFRLLANDVDASATDERRSTEDMLTAMDVDTSGYRVGMSLVFFRSGVLGELEHRRDERLVGMVVGLQAHGRGHLARARLAKRKLADIAVRCVQRNVRMFLNVHDWPWWRLLVRVTPLLNVHRTEEALRARTDELDGVRAKLERAEAERNALKRDNDQLEAKLSELSVDLADERTTATAASERLEAESTERARVERELSETTHRSKQLQQHAERLEMELLYARADLNGIADEAVEEQGDEDAAGADVYRQRYERVSRELEYTKRRLQQQHEDDLEQLVALKKQLEKKVNDAYEEVEEQRAAVGQWRRKAQKLTAELADVKHLLDEQNGRNSLLEKRQRKHDGEAQLLQDELRQERQTRERLARDQELLAAEKFAADSQLQDVRAELEARDERCAALQRDLDELTYGGVGEEEAATLRRQKLECERRLHEQEEELDELAGRAQLLEQAKLKLEMALEQTRKQAKRDAAAHDEELEEARAGAAKKLRALDAQLENAYEERTALVRDKHDLERRLAAAVESVASERTCDEAQWTRTRRDLKRTKALLRDAHAQLERARTEPGSGGGKAAMRALRHQLEDVEAAHATVAKARSALEAELNDTHTLLEDAVRARADAEERCAQAVRDRNDVQAQCDENEEELADVLRKYRACVQQMSLDQAALQEQVAAVGELEAERDTLRDQLAELTSRLENRESVGDASAHHLVRRAELKIKELEGKLELERTTRQRHDVQQQRLRDAADKLQMEVAQLRAKEQTAQEHVRKLQRSVRELREEHNAALSREGETLLRRKDAEKRSESLEAEVTAARADLRLALKRIEDLQAAIQGELDDDLDSLDNSESYASDDSVSAFLAQHNASSTAVATTASSSAVTHQVSSSSTSGSKDGYA